MKKTIFLCSMILMCLVSWADSTHETTTDHLTIGELTLIPGGTYGMMQISLEGSQKYTSYGFDLYLPEGYAFDPSTAGNWLTAISSNMENYSIYPYTQDEREGTKTYTHTFSANMQSDGALRITILSSNSAEFLSNSGLIVKVYVKATSYAKPGYGSVQIKNCYFTTSAGMQYDTEDETISDKLTAGTSSSVALSISADTKWSTCILPFGATIPNGVIAYTCSSKDDTKQVVNLNKASSFAAYTPYVLYSANGYTGTVTGTVDPDKYPSAGYVVSGLLCGAIKAQTITEGHVLQNINNVVKFYSTGGKTFTIPAGKCWLKTSSGEAKAYSFSFDDTPTNINIIAGEETPVTSGKSYNTLGLEVGTSYKGMIIKNGKKYLQR